MDEQDINREELRFPSADGRSTIRALVWWPALAAGTRPQGVVQVIHGMAEHVERYGALARLFASRGFVVCGDDHAGHGASCDPDSYGCLPARGCSLSARRPKLSPSCLTPVLWLKPTMTALCPIMARAMCCSSPIPTPSRI